MISIQDYVDKNVVDDLRGDFHEQYFSCDDDTFISIFDWGQLHDQFAG